MKITVARHKVVANFMYFGKCLYFYVLRGAVIPKLHDKLHLGLMRW